MLTTINAYSRLEIVPVGPAIGRKFAVLGSLLKGNGNSKW